MEPSRNGPFRYLPVVKRAPIKWPHGARVAFWVAPNVEFFPFNQAVPFGIGINPDVLAWSQRDYGGRVGVFRLMKVLAKHGIRATVALNADVCDEYPEVIEEALKLDWEFMGHGESNSNMVDGMDLAEQKRSIAATFDRIKKATGTRPRGWLSPGVRMNWDTPDILIDVGCEYYCDFVNDDQPYLINIDGRQLVNVPYSSEMND
ncbi:MAG: polysaccharide deacetylase family protein, partial [Alphaproteobacteria bacterium]|nr:polysaccharide deacetylase family protein [Alphaproteobacteria bacterium]